LFVSFLKILVISILVDILIFLKLS